MATDIGGIQFDIFADTGQLKLARASVDSFGRTVNTAKGRLNDFEKALLKNSKAQGGAAKQGRKMRGVMQQLGFQIQDVAVQLGAGTNAAQVFGQQGSQIASIFGPSGAVIGALIAVGSAIAAYVFSMEEATEETKSLREQIDELELSTKDLTSAQRAALTLEFIDKQEEINAKMAEQKTAIDEARLTLRQYELQKQNTGGRFNFGISPEAAEEARNQIIKSEAQLDTYDQRLGQLQEGLNDLKFGFGDAGEAAEEKAEKLQKLIAAVDKQADTYGMTAEQIALYEARLLGANDAQLDSIRASFDRIDALKQEEDALEQLSELEKQLATPAERQQNKYFDQIQAIEQLNVSAAEKDAMRERAFELHQQKMAKIASKGSSDRAEIANEELETLREQWDTGLSEVRRIQASNFDQLGIAIAESFEGLSTSTQQAIGALGGVFSNMKEIAKAGGEESFQAYKRLAQAEAAIAGSLAFLKALGSAPPPFNYILAGSVAAVTAVRIAQIDQQQYQGTRRAGGAVAPGSRTLVGEEGPEVLEMGSQSGFVTPMDKVNGQGSANVTQVFQLPENARKEAKQAIFDAAPFIKQLAVQAFLESVSQGGAVSRSVGRRS